MFVGGSFFFGGGGGGVVRSQKRGHEEKEEEEQPEETIKRRRKDEGQEDEEGRSRMKEKEIRKIFERPKMKIEKCFLATFVWPLFSFCLVLFSYLLNVMPFFSPCLFSCCSSFGGGGGGASGVIHK